MHRLTAAILAMALAPAAQAQDTELLEYRDFDVEQTDGPVSIEGSFESHWYEYNNLDFRPLDESSDQAILDSDDRGGFPFTGAAFAMTYDVEPGVRFYFAASHRGLWGADQLGGTNRFGSMVYITNLYTEFTLKPEADRSVRIDVGRRNYELGGLAGAPDFVLSDAVEMVLVDVPLGTVGSLELIPINVVGQTDNDGLDFVGYIGTADLPTFNFRGDTMMRRHGLVARLDELPGPVDLLGYGFYTDIGAGVSAPEMGLFSSGVDITYQGLLGNFTDNDWVANFGLRAALQDVGPVSAWAELNASTGIDRKELVATDVNTNGYALGAGVKIETGPDELPDDAGPEDDKGFRAIASYFDALGPAYGPDGLMFSHGYVGMKGRHAGGQLFNRFMGFHPTAYVSIFGISDTPHEASRKSGTRVIHASAQGDLGRPWIRGSAWFLQDTAFSQLNLNRVDQIDPPFGYARDEFRAQERSGKAIGTELNVDLGYKVTNKVELRGGGGLILPGDYYAVVVARVAGNALGYADPLMPWGLNAGLDVSF